jgi:hypothetical protein
MKIARDRKAAPQAVKRLPCSIAVGVALWLYAAASAAEPKSDVQPVGTSIVVLWKDGEEQGEAEIKTPQDPVQFHVERARQERIVLAVGRMQTGVVRTTVDPCCYRVHGSSSDFYEMSPTIVTAREVNKDRWLVRFQSEEDLAIGLVGWSSKHRKARYLRFWSSPISEYSAGSAPAWTWANDWPTENAAPVRPTELRHQPVSVPIWHLLAEPFQFGFQRERVLTNAEGAAWKLVGPGNTAITIESKPRQHNLAASVMVETRVRVTDEPGATIVKQASHIVIVVGLASEISSEVTTERANLWMKKCVRTGWEAVRDSKKRSEQDSSLDLGGGWRMSCVWMVDDPGKSFAKLITLITSESLR